MKKNIIKDKQFEKSTIKRAIKLREDFICESKISSINAQIIEVFITKIKELPKIGSMLIVDVHEIIEGETVIRNVIFEVASINKLSFKAFALNDPIGIKVNSKVKIFTGGYQVPSGKSILGRVINVVGEPYDESYYVKNNGIEIDKLITPIDEFDKNINEAYDIKPVSDIVETGIKVLDLLFPMPKGGSIGLLGGAGVGKTLIVQELIDTFTDKHKGRTVFVGIGERIREGHELIKESKEFGFAKDTAFVFAQMNEVPGARYRAAITGAAIANDFRNTEKKDILLFVDNIFRYVQAGAELSSLLEKTPSSVGYQPTLQREMSQFQERINCNQNGSITSIQAIYIPADDYSDPSAVNTFAHLDTVMILDRKLASEGIYPAVDPLASTSKLLNTKFVSQEHFNVARQTISVLERYQELSDIITIVGFKGLSNEDKKDYLIGRRIRLFLTQPFKMAEKFSGIPGKYVPLKETIYSFKKILEGKYNNIPEVFFKQCGSIKDVINKHESNNSI